MVPTAPLVQMLPTKGRFAWVFLGVYTVLGETTRNAINTMVKPLDSNAHLGQRLMIIVPIDSHCNLPPNKTHSFSSQLIADPNTFSRRENAPGRVQVQPKKGCKPAFKEGNFRCFGTPQNPSTMKNKNSAEVDIAPASGKVNGA